MNFFSRPTPRIIQKYAPGHLRKCVFISLAHRFIAVVPAKVASQTVKKSLCIGAFGAKQQKISNVNKLDINRKGKAGLIPNPFSSPTDLEVGYANEILSSRQYLRFTFARNPYTRAVSAYLNKIAAPSNMAHKRTLYPYVCSRLRSDDAKWSLLDFLEAVERQPDEVRDLHFQTLTHQTLKADMRFDFVARLENFNEDFERILGAIADRNQLPGPWCIHKSDTHSTKSIKHLAEETMHTKNAINRIYEKDFQSFGYSFD